MRFFTVCFCFQDEDFCRQRAVFPVGILEEVKGVEGLFCLKKNKTKKKTMAPPGSFTHYAGATSDLF